MKHKYWFERLLLNISESIFIAWMKTFRPKLVEQAIDKKQMELAQGIFLPLFEMQTRARDAIKQEVYMGG